MTHSKRFYSSSSIEIISGIDVLDLHEKDHYATGYAMGKLFIETENGFIAFLKNPFIKVILSILFVFKKRRMAEIRVPKQYTEELRGLSDATGIAYHHLLLVNLIYEIRGCSGFMFFNKNNELIVGHNTDTGTILARFLLKQTRPLVINVSLPNKNTFVHVSLPGFFGAINGFNDKGIALSSHDVGGLRSKVVPGNISASCLLRMILEEAKDLGDIGKITHENLSYTPGIYLIASDREKRVVIVELHPSEANIVVLNQKFAFVANHYMSSHMQKYHRDIKKGSLQRIECLKECFSTVHVETVEQAITILQDHRNGTQRDTTGHSIANEGTFQSFVLAVTNQKIFISNGRKTPVPLHGTYIRNKFIL